MQSPGRSLGSPPGSLRGVTLVSQTTIESLASALGDGDGYRVVSVAVEFDPFDFARTGAAMVDRAVAYATPWGDRLVGLGTAWHATASGPGRFADLRSEISTLENPDAKVFVGYAFHDDIGNDRLWRDFATAEAFVPRIAIEQVRGDAKLTVTVPPGESPGPTLELLGQMRRPEPIPVVDAGDHSIESIPHVSDWAETVAAVVDDLRAGVLDKVVLARSVKVESTEPVAILRVFRELVRRYPQCYNFAWKSGESVFMGASPELLAQVEAGAFRSNPLAGSAPRGEGDLDDERIGEALLASDKDQEEHRLVVEELRRSLPSVVDDLTIPDRPVLKKMATVQHLSTEIEGHVAPGVGVLDVIDVIHPTPAVGGVPARDAVKRIAEVEAFARGWYAGGVGWVTPSGDGAVAIALRCGLVQDATTHLFAGAGIMAGSDPSSEVLETRLKLRPLLDLLAAT